MGWLWSSTTLNPPSESRPHNEDLPQPSSRMSEPESHDASSFWTADPPAPPDSSTEHTPSPSSQPRTRDEVANEEVLAFFRQLEAERKRATEPPPGDADFDDDDDIDDDPDDEPPALLTPARLYDTHARCSGLFDTAFFCSSPGGHVCDFPPFLYVEVESKAGAFRGLAG